MKKILVFISLITSTISFAQFGIAPNFSFGITMNKHKSFNNFVNSYNEVIRTLPDYQEDLNPWGATTSFDAGLGVTFGGIVMFELNYFTAKQKTKVNFTTGHFRKFIFQQNECNFMTTFGKITEKGFQIGGGVGINLVYGQLQSSYVFSDGYESFGEDGRLNGVFKFVAVKPTLGLRLSVPVLPKVSVSAKADWIFGGSADSGIENRGFRDLFRGKNTGSAYNYNKLPQNYDPSITSTTTSDAAVNSDWKEFRIKLGVTIFIFTNL